MEMSLTGALRQGVLRSHLLDLVCPVRDQLEHQSLQARVEYHTKEILQLVGEDPNRFGLQRTVRVVLYLLLVILNQYITGSFKDYSIFNY